MKYATSLPHSEWASLPEKLTETKTQAYIELSNCNFVWEKLQKRERRHYVV
jgi:hypothetical protein